jgi:hypothetical protein
VMERQFWVDMLVMGWVEGRLLGGILGRN